MLHIYQRYAALKRKHQYFVKLRLPGQFSRSIYDIINQ